MTASENRYSLMKGVFITGGGKKITSENIPSKEKLFPTSTDKKRKPVPNPKETKIIMYKTYGQKLYLGDNFIEGRVDRKLSDPQHFQVIQWWNRHNIEHINFEIVPTKEDLEECLDAQKKLKSSVSVMCKYVWQEMYVEAAQHSEYKWLKNRTDMQEVKSWSDLISVLNERADVDKEDGRMAEVCSYILIIDNVHQKNLTYYIFRLQAFHFKYYGMGINANAVLDSAHGKLCEYMNIVVRGKGNKVNNIIEGARNGPVQVDFMRRLLKCKLTELRTHEMLPHLVKRRKKVVLNKNGNRLRLGSVVAYDAEHNLNTTKKRHSEHTQIFKKVEECTPEYMNKNDLIKILFEEKKDDEAISITKIEMLRIFDDESKSKKRRVEEDTSDKENSVEKNGELMLPPPLDIKESEKSQVLGEVVEDNNEGMVLKETTTMM